MYPGRAGPRDFDALFENKNKNYFYLKLIIIFKISRKKFVWNIYYIERENYWFL